MTRRTLSLRREALTELTAADLAGVVGADATILTCTEWLRLTERLGCQTVLCAR